MRKRMMYGAAALWLAAVTAQAVPWRCECYEYSCTEGFLAKKQIPGDFSATVDGADRNGAELAFDSASRKTAGDACRRINESWKGTCSSYKCIEPGKPYGQ